MLRGWDFQILASDINTEVLKTASDGIYTQERIEGIDERFLRKYFLRGTGPSTGYFQVRPEVRSLVQFKQINLMDAHWPIHDRFDVIFCRNVIIYFNAQTQQRLLPRLVHQIIDHGHLILGHSENLHWLTDLIAPLGNTVYQRKSSGRATLSAPEPDCVASSRLLPRHVSKKPASLVEEIPHKNHHSTSLAIMRGRRTSATKRREIIAGEYFASREPMIISTLLGSCVGACLFDPEMHIGGMTHFMLPFHHDKMETSSRYGINAMELLINEIMKHGGDRRRLRAKVFGGANVMPQAHWPWDVGKRNIEFIRHFLKTDDIPIVAERLGGKMPLRIVFVPTSGRAFVKEIRARKSILDRELFLLEHAEKPDVQPPFGEVTLF
jgi:chemotaxis receptor (MCP) glutamine deamidase CheD